MTDPEIEAQLETVAHRVEFLELLDDDGPLSPRDIVDELSHSRPTVTRALGELREAGLVEQREEGYVPTLAGTMAGEEYRRYESASEAILSSKDLLEPIPAVHAPPVEVLADANTLRAETAVPVRALETVADRVRRAETVRAYLPTLVNTHLLRVWHRTVVATGVESEAVFDPDLLTALKGLYPHLLSEMAATEAFSASATTGPPYGLILTTADGATTATLVVYEGGTALRGILTNGSPAAVEWAQAEFDRLASDATDVTADLDALSAAVADGVSPIGGPGPGSTATRGSGDGPARAAGGHALPIELEAEGFVRLSREYFDAHGQAPPAVSWRTGFTLAEVHAGHAVDRFDAEGRNLTRHLVESAHAGTDHAVLGPPGSGKSTLCMAVACEWYDRGFGPVLYRERGDGDRFDSPALLEAYLRQTDGHALVVVEDAVREEANAVFEVMQTLDGDPSVSFLLDARTHEWHNPDGFDLDARREAYRRTAIEEITVPGLDERDCERFAAHFSELVDVDVDLSGAELFARIEEGAATTGEDSLPAGDALVAQHYLARRHHRPEDVDTATVTALDETVRHTYRTLTDSDVRLAPDLAVMVALLTAAGIPVAGEYLHAIAPDDEYPAVDEAITLLTGQLLFEEDQPRAGSPTTYRTRHETWAMRFLEQFLAVESPQRASELVGEHVTQLLALADEPARREGIQRHLDGRTPHLHRIEADSRHWADEITERLFSVGQTNADLAPLFGETGDGLIKLPEACSAWTRLQQAYWRGKMNLTHGDLGRAEREFRTLGELAETVDVSGEQGVAPPSPLSNDSHAVADDVAAHRKRWRATSRTELGTVARDRGEYEAAEEHHRKALALFREVDDPVGEATSLKNLGVIAFYRSDYDEAREYYQRSLEIAVEHGAGRIELDCRNNLGGIAWKQGEYDRAREYLERSLDLSRDVGDRVAESSCLNNLGDIARAQDEFDRAREYYEQSLAIFRELGHRRPEATNLNNLGQVARRQGAFDQAREYLEQSLVIKRELEDVKGETQTLRNLGEVARARGAYDRAREHLERGLAIVEDLSDRQREAAYRNSLGRVAYQRGHHDEAREYLEGSLAIARELDLRAIEARCLADLGRLALEQDETGQAREYLDRAQETFEEIGSEHGVARCRLLTGRLALARNEVDLAHEHAREARGTFEELETLHWQGRSRHLEGLAAAAAGEPGEAREHWRTAVETFDEIGAPQDALTTLKELVETCRAEGDEQRAREWCERARDVLSDAPDPTAARHRGWIERQAAR